MRVIFVGIRNDLKYLPEKLHPIGFLLQDNQISIREAIMDLPQIKSGEGAEKQKYCSEPQNEYQKWARENSEFVYNHIAMRHTKRLIDRFAVIKQGESLANVSEEYMQRKRGDVTRVSGKVYAQNSPFETIYVKGPNGDFDFVGKYVAETPCGEDILLQYRKYKKIIHEKADIPLCFQAMHDPSQKGKFYHANMFTDIHTITDDEAFGKRVHLPF